MDGNNEAVAPVSKSKSIDQTALNGEEINKDKPLIVRQVIPYDEVEKNTYRPDQQLKYGQGTYEAVRIIAHPDIIDVLVAASNANTNDYNLNRAINIAKKYGFTDDAGRGLPSLLHRFVKNLAKENRSQDEEVLIEIVPNYKSQQNEEIGNDKGSKRVGDTTLEDGITEPSEEETADFDAREIFSQLTDEQATAALESEEEATRIAEEEEIKRELDEAKPLPEEFETPDSEFEVKYQQELNRDEPLARDNPELTEFIRERLQSVFPFVKMFDSKEAFEAAASRNSKQDFSLAYIGAAIKNLVFVDPEKAVQRTAIHEHAHIYWDALPQDMPLKKELLDKYKGNEENAIDAIAKAGELILKGEAEVVKSGFLQKWLKRFWKAITDLFTDKSIEQAFAERLLTNADEIDADTIRANVVKYMRLQPTADESADTKAAVDGVKSFTNRDIKDIPFKLYHSLISADGKPNDFRQKKQLNIQQYYERRYNSKTKVTELSDANFKIVDKAYDTYVADYAWAEENVWSRFGDGEIPQMTIDEIKVLQQEAQKHKSIGAKDANDFMADLYTKAVFFNEMQLENERNTFNKPFTKLSYKMMTGVDVTDMSGSMFVSGNYSLLSGDRVTESILQAREKLYRRIQDTAKMEEDTLNNEFREVCDVIKKEKEDFSKIIDKDGKHYIDTNSVSFDKLKSGTVGEKALARFLELHIKYEDEYGGLSEDNGRYRVARVRADFPELVKKYGHSKAARIYMNKPHLYDNITIDTPTLSRSIMSLKDAKKEVFDAMPSLYPWQVAKAITKIKELEKAAKKQYDTGINADGSYVTSSQIERSQYGISFEPDEASTDNLEVAAMQYHFANIQQNALDQLLPLSTYIQNYLGNKDLPNMKKWVKIQDDDLIHHVSPTSALGEYGKYVQKLVNYTHWLQLGFNLAGAPFNAFAGFAQSVREVGFRNTLRGISRIVSSVNKEGKLGNAYSKAINIMQRLHIVSTSKDLELTTANKAWKKVQDFIFSPITGVEYINHAYSFIGAMTQEEWAKVKALPGNATSEDYISALGQDRIDELHTLTQKINGAYSPYSKRGINKTPEGRALMQFKNWMPDVIFAHFTSKNLNPKGEDLYGKQNEGIVNSIYNTVWEKTLKPTFKNKSLAEAKENWKNLSEHERLQVGKAMRELVIIGGLAMVVSSMDDDDDKKLKEQLARAMGDVTYIFDFNNLQFLFKGGIPIFQTISNLLKTTQETFKVVQCEPGIYNSSSYNHDKGDYKLPVLLLEDVPAKKLFKNIYDVTLSDN